MRNLIVHGLPVEKQILTLFGMTTNIVAGTV